jgi:hypothetical protein
VSSCVECDKHEATVAQAESALNYAGKKLKRLDALTYSEVRQFEQLATPLRQALTTARSNLTRHRNKCGARP